MPDRRPDYLRSEAPGSAVGLVRRIVDGGVADEAEFLYLAPDRWRVRHTSGREIISVGPEVWERPDTGAAWSHARAEAHASVHHTGYLRSMLFPERLTPLIDRTSRVVDEEQAADGSRRLRVDHDEPVPGTMVVDIGPDGRLRWLEGVDGDLTIRIELTADYASPPDPDVFHPSRPWPQNGPR